MMIAARIGGITAIAAGSPNRPVVTAIPAATTVIATIVSAGETNGRRRQIQTIATGTIGAASRSATTTAMLASSASEPVSPRPNRLENPAAQVATPSAGAIRKVQPLPGNTQDMYTKAATQNAVGNTRVSTRLSVRPKSSSGRTENTRRGTAAQAIAAPIGCEKARPRSESATAITSEALLRARRSNSAPPNKSRKPVKMISDGPAIAARSTAGCRTMRNIINAALKGCMPRRRKEANSDPASKASTPAVSSTGVGVPDGVTNSSKVVARNGIVG